MEYTNKVVWITGASSGIGEALAYEFAKIGAILVLSGRNTKELERVSRKCNEEGAECFICPLDLSVPASIQQAAEQVNSRFGRIDFLVNNGGISLRSHIIDTAEEVDRRIMEVNYFGSVILTKAVLPMMIKNRGGHITVISSISGKLSVPVRSAYTASKHALHGFFDTLRLELADKNIKVTIVCPGRIRTNISINALEGDGSKHGVMDAGQEKGMPVQKCAKKIMRAIHKRRREVHIGFAESFLAEIRRFWPWLFFLIAKRVNPM
jgi:dehydrogenase/reductase SDR family protein 7B